MRARKLAFASSIAAASLAAGAWGLAGCDETGAGDAGSSAASGAQPGATARGAKAGARAGERAGASTSATAATSTSGDAEAADAGSADDGSTGDGGSAGDGVEEGDAGWTDAAGGEEGARSPTSSLLAAGDARKIDAAVEGAIARREIPGAVVLVVAQGQTAYHRAYGLRAKEPAPAAMTREAVFDLASLTKPIVTATSIALLAERGKLRFSDAVAKHLPAFGANGKGAITIEQLLLHTSGLPADNALSEYAGDRAAAIGRVLAAKTAAAPGEKLVYSDVGYIVLGEVVARVSGVALDAFARRELFAPLGMRDTGFLPAGALAARAAPTERLGDVMLTGRVHDPRARALGGVAGHAGLFSTAADLGVFARMVLGGGAVSRTRVLADSTVRELVSPRDVPGGKRAYLGAVTGDAVSHTGFTGTSMWLVPKAKAAVIVLSNRVHPDGKGSADRLRREAINAGVAAAMNVNKAPSAAVQTGIDALAAAGFAALVGRKVALLTHAAGRAAGGRSTIDVLRGAPGVTVVSLLAPEHGIRSDQEGSVASAKDAASGLPVHSLYGAEKRPTKAMLEGADTLVIDLQDAGVRFYTYETTLGYALEAAAELGVEVVVLDRPNPVGGVRVAGPVLDEGKESFVGYHRVPVQHGMTMGELAKMFVAERKLAAKLTVIGMKGWKRAALFADTGLAWTAPSPNLKSPTAALLYPGVGLLEMTNVSVGRGTARPFEVVGAPWIDGAALAKALGEKGISGVTFAETTFTPASSTFKGEACKGVAITVTKPAEVDAVPMGLAIAVELRRLHAGVFRAAGLGTLLGHERALGAVVAGEPLEKVLATFAGETGSFAERRRAFLLY